VVPQGAPVVAEVVPIPAKIAATPIRMPSVVAKRSPVVPQFVSSVGELAPILTNASRRAHGLGRQRAG
jgi:hypothetical protein